MNQNPNSSKNSKENSAHLANFVNLRANSSKNSANSNENSTANSANSSSNSGSNFWANFRQILVLPKWAKVFLIALSGVAVAGLIAAFGLKAWAADKVDSGEIALKGIDKGAQERILKAESAENKFAFESRLYFQRLDFLLRSKVIAYIDIQGISWADGVDKNAVTNISSHNRWVKFTTTQDLLSQGFADKNLGQVSYKMDFSPLIATILKYYFAIAFLVLVFAPMLFYISKNANLVLAQNGGGGGASPTTSLAKLYQARQIPIPRQIL